MPVRCSKKETKYQSSLVGLGKCIWFSTHQPFAGVHGGAGIDWMHAGHSKRHLHGLDHEGEDREGPHYCGIVSEMCQVGLSTQPYPLRPGHKTAGVWTGNKWELWLCCRREGGHFCVCWSFVSTGHSSEQLQMMLNCTKEFADWAGLKFWPNKCVMLMINSWAARHFVEKTTFHIGSGELPSMKWEDHYCYLGYEVGWDPCAKTKEAGENYRKVDEKILEN